MQNIGGLCALSPTGLSTPDTGGEPGLGPERKENPTCTESGARAQGEESGMSNIQLNFTFNRLTTSPPACPSAHFLSSLMFKVCKDFPDFHINTRCEQGNVVTYVSPTGPLRELHSHLWEKKCAIHEMIPGPREKSAGGECDADIFAKCHECHDLATFIQNPAYTKHCTSSTNHLCHAMTLPYSLNSSFMKWLLHQKKVECVNLFYPFPLYDAWSPPKSAHSRMYTTSLFSKQAARLCQDEPCFSPAPCPELLVTEKCWIPGLSAGCWQLFLDPRPGEMWECCSGRWVGCTS